MNIKLRLLGLCFVGLGLSASYNNCSGAKFEALQGGADTASTGPSNPVDTSGGGESSKTEVGSVDSFGVLDFDVTNTFNRSIPQIMLDLDSAQIRATKCELDACRVSVCESAEVQALVQKIKGAKLCVHHTARMSPGDGCPAFYSMGYARLLPRSSGVAVPGSADANSVDASFHLGGDAAVENECHPTFDFCDEDLIPKVKSAVLALRIAIEAEVSTGSPVGAICH